MQVLFDLTEFRAGYMTRGGPYSLIDPVQRCFCNFCLCLICFDLDNLSGNETRYTETGQNNLLHCMMVNA